MLSSLRMLSGSSFWLFYTRIIELLVLESTLNIIQLISFKRCSFCRKRWVCKCNTKLLESHEERNPNQERYPKFSC